MDIKCCNMKLEYNNTGLMANIGHFHAKIPGESSGERVNGDNLWTTPACVALQRGSLSDRTYFNISICLSL